MDYPCGKFGDCSSSRFGFIVWTDRHSHSHTYTVHTHISQVLHDWLTVHVTTCSTLQTVCWCTRLYMVLHRNIWQTTVSLCLWSVAEADCDHLPGVTSSSSQQQQTSGDDPLLCPLQQHGTRCHQTSGIFSRWGISNPDSRLICLTVTDMTTQHCILRSIDNLRPCNGWWGSMLRRVRNCRFIICLLYTSPSPRD